MSGGIDSCISAYLLKKEGYDITGLTLKLWDDGSRCCDLIEIERAQRFAHKIGIPHYVIDLRKEFKKLIVDYFTFEYLKGRTPNPCVVCNQKIKFASLLGKKNMLDFDYTATGHYAGIVKKKEGYFLSKAKDQKKSQEYFLSTVEKENLKKILFPLSELSKEEVKKIAEKINFTFRADESQEVCFIKPGIKYYEYILNNIKIKKDFSAEVINKKNEVLGRSSCYFKYTIGQRGGLGISNSTPYYVLKINAEKKSILVGKKEDTFNTAFSIKNLYWYTKKPQHEARVKFRYNHKEAKAVIENKRNKTIVRFFKPQQAIPPGQIAVFYNGDLVIGSAWIDEVLPG